jgi:hypothetical protein
MRKHQFDGQSQHISRSLYGLREGEQQNHLQLLGTICALLKVTYTSLE